MKIEKTFRGFAYVEFKDRYGKACSLQKSSLADEDCIWLGIDKAEPQIMAIDAIGLGLKVNSANGWVDYPVPSQVQIPTRMHLTQEQVRELLPLLQKFVETGDLS